jgi:LemA protein
LPPLNNKLTKERKERKMKAIRILGLLIALSTTAVCASGCGLLDQGVQKYDTLVDKDEDCNNKWSDYESNLQRRADMIPQLVAVVKGSAAHENSTLTAVIQARADASKIVLNPKDGDFEDAKKFAEYQAAQTKVHTSLQQLQENYPQLQANAAFHDLQVQIEGTENRLLRAREEYNRVVSSYNTELRHVSGKVLNPITGHEFRPRVYFTADADAKVAPKIDFGSTPAPAAK